MSMVLRIPNSESMSRLPGVVRFLLGCLLGIGAMALTSAIGPFRSFPLLLAFPTVILSAWFLGMGGAAGCALTDVVVVDIFLTRSQFQFSNGNPSEKLRMAAFVLVTLLLGWSIRRLAQQKAMLEKQELEVKLQLEQVERRLAEERAAAIEQVRYRDDILKISLQASGMGLWAWDLEREVVYRSDEVFRMAGFEPGAFGSEPDAWFRRVHPEDVAAVKEAFQKTRMEGTAYHMEYRVVWPDGSLHWLESQGQCQRDDEGKVIRIVGVMADVTKRRQSGEALLRAEKLAVAGRLAASVAHEINNPLEAVANMLYLITIADTTEQARVQASEALDELMRISLIAQSTLKFHRESGHPRVTLLSDVVDSVLAMFRGKLETLQIAVAMETKDEVPITCMASEAHQIFANLVANAIDAMQPKGTLRIRIRPSCDWSDRSVHGIRVTVADTGSGISRAMMRRIFEPFFTTKMETGTGLGLWVVAQLIERRKGNLHVWSSQQPGASGTAFSAFLPFENSIPRDDSSGGRGEEVREKHAQRAETFVPWQFLQHQNA